MGNGECLVICICFRMFGVVSLRGAVYSELTVKGVGRIQCRSPARVWMPIGPVVTIGLGL